MNKYVFFIGIIIASIIGYGVAVFLPKDSEPIIFDSKKTELTDSSTTSPVANDIVSTVSLVPETSTSTPEPITKIQPSRKQVETPGPLIVKAPAPITPVASKTPIASTTPTTPVVVPATSPTPSSTGVLDQAEILSLTNVERAKEGLRTLTYDAKLAKMAETKARDMIAKGYFAHVSPTGVDIVMLAEQSGYAYLNIGENLALGDFISSQEVVTGWMNSPGHRANILNKNFTQLGVAAIIGAHEGRDVWYAVQEFGRPMSDCEAPSVTLKQKIDADQIQAKTLEATLLALKAEIDTPGISVETYNSKVNEYNAIAVTYNDLIGLIKTSITEYNSMTDTYNQCITVP